MLLVDAAPQGDLTTCLGYEPQSVQRVTIVSGHTSTVTFSNVLKRGSLKVIKSSEDNFVEGAVIVLACIIFSVFASSPPTVDTSAAAVTQVWSYIGELIFNMLVLVGSVKMSDRIIREMMGL